MNGILISATCAILLIFLVFALIFSDKFRGDILGHEGEAKVLGIFTVKGVAIVLLSAIFLGGMIYPLTTDQAASRCAIEIQKISSLVHAKYRYEIEYAANKPDRSTLEKMVDDLQKAVKAAEECVNS